MTKSEKAGFRHCLGIILILQRRGEKPQNKEIKTHTNKQKTNQNKILQRSRIRFVAMGTEIKTLDIAGIAERNKRCAVC